MWKPIEPGFEHMGWKRPLSVVEGPVMLDEPRGAFTVVIRFDGAPTHLTFTNAQLPGDAVKTPGDKHWNAEIAAEDIRAAMEGRP